MNDVYFEWLSMVIPLPASLMWEDSISFSSESISLELLPFESKVAQPSSSIRPASRSAIWCRSRGFKKRGWKMSWLTWGCKGTRIGRSVNVSSRWDKKTWYWRRPNPRPWRKTIGRGEVVGSHLAGIRSKYLMNRFKSFNCSWGRNLLYAVAMTIMKIPPDFVELSQNVINEADDNIVGQRSPHDSSFVDGNSHWHNFWIWAFF